MKLRRKDQYGLGQTPQCAFKIDDDHLSRRQMLLFGRRDRRRAPKSCSRARGNHFEP